MTTLNIELKDIASKDDYVQFGFNSKKNQGTSSGTGSPVMNIITKDIYYEFTRDKSIYPIDGSDDHILILKNEYNVTELIRLNEKNNITNIYSFTINYIRIYSNKIVIEYELYSKQSYYIWTLFKFLCLILFIFIIYKYKRT